MDGCQCVYKFIFVIDRHSSPELMCGVNSVLGERMIEVLFDSCLNMTDPSNPSASYSDSLLTEGGLALAFCCHFDIFIDDKKQLKILINMHFLIAVYIN